MEFKVGDKAVFPAHGVGVIKSVESREIGGSKQGFLRVAHHLFGRTLDGTRDGLFTGRHAQSRV